MAAPANILLSYSSGDFSIAGHAFIGPCLVNAVTSEVGIASNHLSVVIPWFVAMVASLRVSQAPCVLPVFRQNADQFRHAVLPRTLERGFG